MAGLSELAEAMGISRMGVHKHLQILQERGIVDSIEIRNGVGRPRMQISINKSRQDAISKVLH
jgi:predicted ArsR family transcriptional regulator